MRWYLFEDRTAGRLHPLSLARPVFELVCGRESLRRRVQRWFPGTEWGVFVRDYLQDVYAEEHPGASVNDIRTPQTQASLFINGQWLPEHRIPSDGAQHVAGFVDGTLAWVWVQPDEAAAFEVDDLPQMLATIARSKHTIDAGGRIIDRPWNLVAANAQQLIDDFSDEGVSQAPQQPHVQCLGDPRDVYVSPEAAIDPYVVLDTRHGPISISKGAHVQSFTRIEGPCHIARESQIFRALIHGGTTIGPVCRVGGEVEESILQAFVNKYHEGFLGHSYVCPWVNSGRSVQLRTSRAITAPSAFHWKERLWKPA